MQAWLSHSGSRGPVGGKKLKEQLGTIKAGSRDHNDNDDDKQWLHLERVTKDGGKSERLYLLLFLNSCHCMSPALDFPRRNCHRRADYLSSWLSIGSPGQGQSPCTAAFREVWRQGTTAGETLLHKEFMSARNLSQGMDKSRDLRKISTGGLGENRYHGAELPQSFFHWTVLHQIHVLS